MKNIEKLKNDINNLILERNKTIYKRKFCDICYNTIHKYDLKRHFLLSENHDRYLTIFINENYNNNLSNDEIIKKYTEISNFYINEFIYMR